MKEALKGCKNYTKRLKKRFNFDEEFEKSLLYILSLPFVEEDNEYLRKLKNYKGIFKHLQENILKHIELNGKKYYSFWEYGLEDVENLNELKKELFM
jgi:TRAP-type C4-dicarboxylate transport system substrate-binding protein